MTVKEYIASGVLESYILGSASEEESQRLLMLKKQHPEIQEALFKLEEDLELIAEYMAVPPPPGMLTRIEGEINALIEIPGIEPHLKERQQNGYQYKHDNQFIEIEAESNEMRVNKAWKWIFVTVFALSKLFLICSIYYFLENRQAQEQIKELKTELQHYRAIK